MSSIYTIDKIRRSFPPGEVRRSIGRFIKGKVCQESGLGQAVLGLSGGVDSSTVAALAVEGLHEVDRLEERDGIPRLKNKEDSHLKAYIMPALPSREGNMSDAELVAETLNIPYEEVDVEPFVELVEEKLDLDFDDLPEDRVKLARANARARARNVMILYTVANLEGRLVLGTGNLTEASLGYFTKYGDGAVDIHPLGKLLKVHVRTLADHLGVPKKIREKKPTAGLWEGQTDEEELGVTYDEADVVLRNLFFREHTEKDAVVGGLAREWSDRDVDPLRIVNRIEELYEQSRHKLEMPPSPCHIADPLGLRHMEGLSEIEIY